MNPHHDHDHREYDDIDRADWAGLAA
ncbi:hypothetical protein SEA_DIRTYBOI_62 [Gordonia phage DirtyBoi]|nr:hypothetical protein SEA_DIRTYBOI_62 [Gordonia phage DirtyBoi]